MPLGNKIRGFWVSCQQELFPWMDEVLGPLTGRYKQLLLALEMVSIERFLPSVPEHRPGRPLKHRAIIARAFLAKMVFNIPTTAALIERMRSDPKLRRLCGWQRERDVPSESTFSRAFQEFAEADLPGRLHAALIEAGYQEQIVGHISRDSTAIEAREKPVRKKQQQQQKHKRGRPRKGEVRSKKQNRLELQRTRPNDESLEELPKECDVGAKRNASGHQRSWNGYKLHMDVADGSIPISCVVTSASLHDSQAAIPLMRMTTQRVCYLYDLMDSAYDAEQIHAHSKSLGHVPIIDSNPRRNGKAERVRENKAQRAARFVSPERVRYKERSTVERAFGRLKDEFGGRHVRVRGHKKVTCHLMFGVLALTVDQLLRLSH